MLNYTKIGKLKIWKDIIVKKWLNIARIMTTSSPKRAKLDLNDESSGSPGSKLLESDMTGEFRDGEDSTENVVKNLDEKMLGIECFVGNHKGFRGSLKQRFSDFVVHELTKTGEHVKLTNENIPDAFLNSPSEIKIDEMDEKLAKLLSNDTITQLTEVKDKIRNDVKILSTSLNKEERKSIHGYIKVNYPALESNTSEIENEKYIIIKTAPKNRNKTRHDWPTNLPEFTHFTLYQESMGTQDAISLLSKKLHRTPKAFQYAGTKDKRGISSQRCSLYKTIPQKLLNLNKELRRYNKVVYVGDFSFENDPINLGDHDGNQFDIVLRDVEFDDKEDIGSSINSIKEYGFINYFGAQRFGRDGKGTSGVGLAILQNDYEKAVDKILCERQDDLKPRFEESALTYNECMKLWNETKNASEVLRKFKFSMSPEILVLKALASANVNCRTTNFQTGIQSLPRNNRNMYLHSYQSLIWNRLTSYRFKQFGNSVVPGDIFIKDNNKCEPMIVTDANIQDVSIYDIVLPMVTFDSVLPENCVKDELERLLKEDSLTLNSFNLETKAFLSSGDYRKIFIKPKNLSWKLLKYTNNNIRLIQTDLQKMLGEEIIEEETGDKTALKLSFSLQPSAYATVLTRELRKKDIYYDHNQAFNKKL